MTGGVAITGGFSYLLDKNFRKVFFDEYMRVPEQYSKIAKMDSWDGNYFEEGELIGLGALQKVHEGAALPFDKPAQGNKKRVYFTNFALGFQITENMWDDDQIGHMRKVPAELGRSAAYTRELEYFDILNSGFVDTVRVGMDGLSLFNTAHPILGTGETYSNRSAAALSKTAAQGVITNFRELTNQKGIPIINQPRILVIPPSLEWVAKEMLLSKLDPDSANNAINVMEGELSYMISNYLTSDNAWFVLGDHDLRFIWRKKVAFQNTDDFNTGNAMFKATCRFTTDFFEWRGAFGSTGI